VIKRTFRSASTDDRKVSLRVISDRFVMVARCPLLTHKRPDRCIALLGLQPRLLRSRGHGLIWLVLVIVMLVVLFNCGHFGT
jgi:hypothetical protein